MLIRLSVLMILMVMSTVAVAGETIRVMSYNILRGGVYEDQPLSRTVDVLKAANADLIGIQERGENLEALAEAIELNAHPLGASTGILSRYPIVEHSANGVVVETGSGIAIAIYNVHLAAYPYQPYDLRDGKITTEEETIEAARASRYITGVLQEMDNHLSAEMPVFLVGDFNEPSHLDWTAEAARQDIHPLTVAWPISTDVIAAGLQDGFRAIYPNPVTHPAYTWTPGYLPPNMNDDEVHDRIDRVYFAGKGVKALSAEVIGPDETLSTIIVEPYPSDHRAVLVEFAIESSTMNESR